MFPSVSIMTRKYCNLFIFDKCQDHDDDDYDDDNGEENVGVDGCWACMSREVALVVMLASPTVRACAYGNA